MPLHKLNFNAGTTEEYEHNLQLLVRAMRACKVKRVRPPPLPCLPPCSSEGDTLSHVRMRAYASWPQEVPVINIAKGKFQDTFEFLQWCYSYLHQKYPDADYTYRALERRHQASTLMCCCSCVAVPHQPPTTFSHRHGSTPVERRRRGKGHRSRAAHGMPRQQSNPNLVPKTYSILPVRLCCA